MFLSVIYNFYKIKEQVLATIGNPDIDTYCVPPSVGFIAKLSPIVETDQRCPRKDWCLFIRLQTGSIEETSGDLYGRSSKANVRQVRR